MGGLIDFLKFFGCDDAGAVTIGWIAISSLSLLLGIVVSYMIFNADVASLTSGASALILFAGKPGGRVASAIGNAVT